MIRLAILVFAIDGVRSSPVVFSADADALMHEGVALRRSGDDAAALKRFQQAYELGKSPRALAQMGLAEQALGRWAFADQHLRQALDARDDAWIGKNRASIDDALTVVASHVGKLEINGEPRGAEVRVDGELVGRLPLAHPITVTAGGVAVEVRAPGYVPIVRAATVSAHTLTRESFTLQSLSPTAELSGSVRGGARPANTAPTAAPAGSPGPASEGGVSATGTESDSSPEPEGPTAETHGGGVSGRRVLTLAAGGLSLASVAFGVFEHLSWQRKVESFSSMTGCGSGLAMRGDPGCKPIYDDGQRARLLAFVGYGLAGAFAATALVLYLTDGGAGSEPGKVACAPALMASGLACALTF